jgi:hypothetical protein
MRADGSFHVEKTRRESQGSDVWGRLEFGDDSSVDLSVEPDTPFIIGKNASTCDRVVVDEWIDTSGQKGSRVSAR